MRHLPILIFTSVLLFVIMPGCEPAHPEETPAPEYKSGLSDTAWMMLDSGADFADVLRVQQEAVRCMHEGNSHEDPVAVLEQMAYFLFSKGRLDEAFEYFNEAEDSLRSRQWHVPTESEVMLYGDLSQFYERLGMVEQAILYSDSALAVSRRMEGRLMPDVWRFRTQIYANNGHTAQAFACLDSAYASIRKYGAPKDTATLLAITDGDRANIILSLKTGPDSVALAADILRRVRAQLTDAYFIDFMGVTGYALFLTGEKHEGIRLMEEAVARLRASGDLELSLMETRRLIDAYSAEHDDNKVSALYNEYTLLNDSMRKIYRNTDYVTAKAQSVVATKHRENLMLREKLDRQRRHKFILVSVAWLLVLIFVVVLIFVNRHTRKIKYRRDVERARRLTAEAATAEARSERDLALKRIEAIKNEVAQCPDNEVLQRMKGIVNNFGVFERSFDAIYPGFVNQLRNDFPSLTDTDVTFCMLIYLRFSTEEIAESLNISRASVNSARYRIRTKLMLAKDVNLDKYLCDRK